MYISKKKRSRDVSVPEGRAQSVMAERVLPINRSEGAEPMELERELFLEPEEEMMADEAEETLIMRDGQAQGETSGNGAALPNGEIPSEPAMPDIRTADDEVPDVEVPDDPQDLDANEQSERELTYDEFMRQNTGDGVLRVQASAGGQSIPLNNVNIVVYRDFPDGRRIFYTVVTNADGVADGMILPAPPRVNSVEGNGQSPFASYSLTADREGLRAQTIENVPIFAGVKSIQPINLSPAEREV